MVQFMRSADLQPGSEMAPIRDKVPVKLEIEDSLGEENAPFNKRSKLSSTLQQQWSGTNGFPNPPSQYNPLDEPSPLGLRLRKSPSLLDLIQMRLSQGNASDSGAASSENLGSGDRKKDAKGVVPSGEKLKASNFPASLLRIGSWEYTSRYEGDLVAKCYFAKHKLVWEVLDGGLKSKIEVQWSDIMGLRANCPENGPGTLNVVLARQPLFFRETNPQPRKHTLWQATADFTDGQASVYREHFLQCPQGVLDKHFEKLIQCDMRLNFLSRQPEMVLDSPYFERQTSAFEDPSSAELHGKGPNIPGFQDAGSSSIAQASSLKIVQQEPVIRATEHSSREAPSPSSVMDTHAIEAHGSYDSDALKGTGKLEQQLKVPGLRASISISDFMSHIGHCISEQMTSGSRSLPEEGPDCREMLADIAQYLLSDTQLTTASDEKSLMSRVNSLCCLLQDPTTVQNLQVSGEGSNAQTECATENKEEPKAKDDTVATSKPAAPGMSRKDSYGELLLHLPRIASLPKFLFNISEDGENQAR